MNDSLLDSVPSVSSCSSGLKGSLGATAITLMVIATAAPLTVMVAGTPLIVGMGNGAAAPFDAAIATLIMLLFTIGFVTMSKYITNAGAFYSYIQKGLGRMLGLGSAATALASYFFILIALESYLGYALAEFIGSLTGVAVRWWVCSLLVVCLVGFFGYRHIEMSKKFLTIALFLEILIVIILNVVIISNHARFGVDLTPFAPEVITSGSPGLAVMFAIYCFVGFEATVVYREEARDPSKTIPRATYGAVLVIGVFYVISMWCAVVGIGTDTVKQFAVDHPGDMYQLLIHEYFGQIGQDILQVLLVTSLFACVLAIHNVVVRYQYIFGRYGVLSEKLSRVHERHGSPYVSSIVQTFFSILTIALLASGGLDPVSQIYAWSSTAGTLGYMVILALTCLSVVVFFRKNPTEGSVFKTLVAPVSGLLGLSACLYIAMDNLPSLVGGEYANTAAWVIKMVVFAIFVLGFAKAFRMKLSDPVKFDALKSLS